MKSFAIDFLAEYDDVSIISELRRIASLHRADTLTKAQIESDGRISYSLVVKRFGSLRKALQVAGLQPQRFMNATDEELLTCVVELWQQVLEKEGRTPQRKDLATYKFPVSGDTIIRRFGSWKKALLKANDSVTESSLPTELPSPPIPKPERKRESLSLRKRFFVFKRDSFACVRCGKSGYGVRLEVHHRQPFAKKGPDALDNLETLCFECNRGQRDDFA